MSSPEVLNQLKELRATNEALTQKITELSKPRETTDSLVNPAPHVRRGEDPMTSRGYSFLKALGLAGNQIDKDLCKVELQVSAKLAKYYDSFGFKKSLSNSFFVPMWGEALVGNDELAEEARQVVKAGTRPYSVDEIQAVRREAAKLGLTKALSWIDDSVGGTLVAPPAMGELIEVLRNNEVFIAAGARTLPMPPMGRITYPRQTSAMTAYHVGESQTITDSTPGTGDVTLQAKKLTILAKIPNELFHFSAIPIESFVREDMAKVISLKMDKTLLEDPGSTVTPKGLINYTNINTYTSVGSAADGNSGYPIDPLDPYNMIGTVEEADAVFRAFIMRPLLWATLVTRRADAVTAGDKKGPFAFNVWREIDDGGNLAPERLKVGNLVGYPVLKTTQLSKTRTRGSGTTNNTYVLGGDFNDYLLAMGGALEFQVSTQGDTAFTTDQTWFKGVMYYDGAPRHEASFVLMDNVLTNT